MAAKKIKDKLYICILICNILIALWKMKKGGGKHIKDDLMKVFMEFFNRGMMNKTMRSTFIFFIPKKEGARNMGEYRTISLVGNLYKIISKVLSMRLRGVLG